MSTLRSCVGAAALAALALGRGPARLGQHHGHEGPRGADAGRRARELRGRWARTTRSASRSRPRAQGCHTTGNKPFFASLTAFENGLVYNEKYVKRGDPDNSLLIQLLKGSAPGSYPQMPPGQPYTELVSQRPRHADHRAAGGLDSRSARLRPRQLETPSPEEFYVRRLTAEEMVVELDGSARAHARGLRQHQRPQLAQQGVRGERRQALRVARGLGARHLDGVRLRLARASSGSRRSGAATRSCTASGT